MVAYFLKKGTFGTKFAQSFYLGALPGKSHATYNPTLNIRLPEAFQNITSHSVRQSTCSLLCFQNAACNSFDYNKRDSVCMLNWKQFADVASEDVIPDADFNHYEAEKGTNKCPEY